MTPSLPAPYTIVRELGHGGMATVYLAEDHKHGRQVAVKVLRPELAAVIGAERFVREVRTLAALQHPHILGLIDSGHVDGTAFYVMPFVEGESLRDRLVREKQLSVEVAVRLSKEIAGALDYAHRHGIIHRDIKPENILLHEGRALVADFGIALAVSQANPGRLTETGLSLGTPHYMSPEQAMGERDITARSDIYALGCVAYEMLAGQPPFTGATAQVIVAKVLTDRPASLRKVRERVPEPLEATILKALEKLPADRWSTASEFAGAMDEPRAVGSPRAATWWRDPRTLALIALVAALAGTTAWVAANRTRSVSHRTMEFLLPRPSDLPTGAGFAPRATGVLPDGSGLVYTAGLGDTSRLYLQRFDRLHPTLLAAMFPGISRGLAVSPDGQWVAFLSRDARIWKAPLTGGNPVPLGNLAVWLWDPRLAWGADDRIYWGSGYYGLQAVPAAGGDITPVTRPDTATGERGHWGVWRLPNGRLLFRLVTKQGGRMAILNASRPPTVMTVPGNPVGYVEPGYLLYLGERGLEVVRFDLEKLRVTGAPALVFGGDSILGISVSSNGTAAIVHRLAPEQGRPVVWVDREGRARPTGIRETARIPRLSPDGRRLAFATEQDQVWVFDLATGGRGRLDDEPPNVQPVWTRDGRRLIYSAPGDPWQMLKWQRADGSGKGAELHRAPFETWATDWSPDGAVLVYYSTGGAGSESNDIHVVDTAGNARMIIGGPGIQRNARFSPDGRWIVYESLENGPPNIYLQRWPELDRKLPVSTDGGREPVWAPSGRELFYRRGDAMMIVEVGAGPEPEISAPRVLFRGSFWTEPSGDTGYDISPDGRRFLMMEPDTSERTEIRVILNWQTELERLLRDRPRQ
jgi:serine/threonine-protein kinase